MKQIKIFHFDDSFLWHKLLINIFKQVGSIDINLETVITVTEAEELYQNKKFDLFICDTIIECYNGGEGFLDLLKKENQPVILFLTIPPIKDYGFPKLDKFNYKFENLINLSKEVMESHSIDEKIK